MTPMRLTAALAGLAIALSYLALVQLSPMYTLLGTRGGIVTLTLSMCLANVLIWLAGDPERSVRRRFELAAAGWLWILVQAGIQIYLHWDVRQ